MQPTRKTCSVDSCVRLARARGLCERHYKRWKRHGDPNIVATSGRIPGDGVTSPLERFNEKWVPDANGCWIWQGFLDPEGYGQFRIPTRGAAMNAHRASWTLFVGPVVGRDLHIDHLCRNRACVNPDHLEAVPERVNILRGVGPAAINARKTHCNRGHPFDTGNTYVAPSSGKRTCRACAADNRRRSRARKRADLPAWPPYSTTDT